MSKKTIKTKQFDPRIPPEQGFLVVCPSEKCPKGLVFYSEAAAMESKQQLDERVAKYPENFNLDYWPEKPEPYQVFALTLGKRIV